VNERKKNCHRYEDDTQKTLLSGFISAYPYLLGTKGFIVDVVVEVVVVVHLLRLKKHNFSLIFHR
jgi:hypothetical protein